MSTANPSGIKTYEAASPIPWYSRVVVVAGSASIAGADDADTGVATLPVHAAGDDVPVCLRNVPGTQYMIAAEPISAGMDVFAAANGQVGLDNSKDKCGVAQSNATAAGDYIEVMRVSGGGGGGGGLSAAAIRQFSLVDAGTHADLATANAAYTWPIPAGEKHIALIGGQLAIADAGASAFTIPGGGNVTGRIVGTSNTTLAALGTAAAIGNGNYGLLRVQDGANAPGLYQSNGTTLALVMPMAAAANVDANVANLAARVASLIPAGQQDFTVLVATNGLRYRTVDGGTTWTVVSRRVEVADAAALAGLTEMVENQRAELLSDDTLWEFTAANGWAQIR